MPEDPNQPEKLTLPDKIADSAITIVLTGGVAGGGLENKGKIDQKNKRGLEYMGGKITGGTPEGRYLECQKLFCRAAKSEGADGEAKRELAVQRQKVQDRLYEKLETLLKAQQWKDADYETYRLMITTVGKEEGQYFSSSEELLTFPCEVLSAIDGLWVKYSQGRFGFSMQRQIYVECGGKLDGDYPDNKIWEQFGDRVGWRKEEEWLYDYDNLTQNASLSSSQGMFPSSWHCIAVLIFVVLRTKT
jgi:GUN4-like